jgi:hypothetical protein
MIILLWEYNNSIHKGDNKGMNLKKSMFLACATAAIFSVCACGSSKGKEEESVVDFSEFLPSEPEPVIIRDEAQETAAQEDYEEESSESEPVTPYADRLAGEEPVTYDIVSNTYEEGSVKIVYPSLSGMENVDIQSAINDSIYEKAFAGSDDDDLAAYDLSFETATKGDGLVSFIFRGYENYAQSAHPNNIIKTININVTTGQVLTLKDYADMGELVSDLENASGYEILNEGVDKSDFDMFLNNGYMTDYAMLLLDYDSNSSGYSAIRDNHLVLFIEAEHAMGDYVELEFEKDL